MHEFPAQGELEFLIGCELRTVTLMRWQTFFEFDRARLNVDGAFEHISKDGKVWRLQDGDDEPEPECLRNLCQQTVSEMSVEPLVLSLSFLYGDVLRIFSDKGPYECGQIWDADGEIIVF